MTLKKHHIPIIVLFFVFSACNEASQNLKDCTSNNCEKTCCENSRTKHLLKETLNEVQAVINDSLHCLQPDSVMKMAYIPEGQYAMGASNLKMALNRELPQHQVNVNAFFMDIHEVTNAQFSA